MLYGIWCKNQERRGLLKRGEVCWSSSILRIEQLPSNHNFWSFLGSIELESLLLVTSLNLTHSTVRVANRWGAGKLICGKIDSTPSSNIEKIFSLIPSPFLLFFLVHSSEMPSLLIEKQLAIPLDLYSSQVRILLILWMKSLLQVS